MLLDRDTIPRSGGGTARHWPHAHDAMEPAAIEPVAPSVPTGPELDDGAVRRPLTLLAVLAVVGLAGAGCSSGQSAPAHATTTSTAPSTATSSSAVPTTTAGGSPRVGTSQTARSATGQQVAATPTTPGHQGPQFGGPPGSWDLGLTVENTGPGVFQSIPASQISLVDASGRSYAPVVMQTALTGQPSALPAGGQLRMLLVFALPTGATPVSVTLTPFGTAGPTLRWAG